MLLSTPFFLIHFPQVLEEICCPVWKLSSFELKVTYYYPLTSERKKKKGGEASVLGKKIIRKPFLFYPAVPYI